MESLPNFLKLFESIQHYLAKAPNSPELAEAKKAYNTIIEIMYGPDLRKGTCSTGPVKFLPTSY